MVNKLLIFLIFILFSFQSPAKADDIRDFEIEGISIGDNALDYFTKEEIDLNKGYYPNSKEIWRYLVILEDNQFDSLQIHMKEEGDKYIIVGISGLIYFLDKKVSYNKCLKKRSLIINDLKKILKNTRKSDEDKNIIDEDKSGNSYALEIYFDFKEDNSEYVKIACTFYTEKYSEKTGWPDYLRLALTSTEFNNWLSGPAFK